MNSFRSGTEPTLRPPQHELHLVIERLLYERAMIALKGLSGLPDMDQPHVKGIVEHRRQAIERQRRAAPTAKSAPVQFRLKRRKIPLARGV